MPQKVLSKKKPSAIPMTNVTKTVAVLYCGEGIVQ